jgi:FtsH-binding integral membrane protein
MVIDNIIGFFTGNTAKSAWTSILGFFVGSTAKAADDVKIISDNLTHEVLCALQIISFTIGIVVGLLAIVTWFQKNTKKK